MPKTGSCHLATAELELRGMRTYYRRNPQLDAAQAADALRQAEAVLCANEKVRHCHEDVETVRELMIASTAASHSTGSHAARSG